MEDVESLLPRWSSDAYNNAKEAIESVRKIALPSILELLQEGFERRQGQTGSVLSDGFKKEDFVQRHVLLRYQHRMHPDISRFPRIHIYKNAGNDEDGCLNDPNYMESERHWYYSRYKARALWIDIKGRKDKKYNFNIEEVNSIEKELKHFLRWAELHPKEKISGAWEVAILTFYSAQEKELRKRLQKIFNTRNTRNFWTKNKAVHVSLCTVDRFQGHEADIVFLSFVMDRRIGFLDSPHRLNVALTRARYQLVLIGNLTNFSQRRVKKHRRSELLELLSQEIPAEIDF
jgi:superfamily I DNA and/or RNA helicase